MAQWLDMLNSSNAQTAQFYNFALNAHSKMVQEEMQEKQFEAKLAYQSATMAEQHRMNNVAIEQANFENQIRAAAHNREMALMPLRFQEAKMRLEQATTAQKMASAKSIEENFNAVAAPFEASIGAEFARTQNPQVIHDYMNYKAQALAGIVSGQPYDQNNHIKNIQAIIQGSRENPPANIDGTQWNAETSYLLGRFDPRLQSQYDQRNPTRRTNRLGAISSILTGDDEAYQRTLNEAGGLFNTQESRELLTARNAYQGVNEEIRQRSNWVEQLARQRPKEEDQNYDEWQQEIQEETAQLRRLMKLKRKIFDNAMGSDFDVDTIDINTIDSGEQATVGQGMSILEQLQSRLEENSEENNVDRDRFNPRGNLIKAQEEATENTIQSKLSADLGEKGQSLLKGYEPTFTGKKPKERMLYADDDYMESEGRRLGGAIQMNAESMSTDDIVSLAYKSIRQQNFDKLKGADVVYRDRIGLGPVGSENINNYAMTFDSVGAFDFFTDAASGYIEPRRTNRGVAPGRSRPVMQFESPDEAQDYIEEASNEVEKRQRALQVYTAMAYSLLELSMSSPKNK